MAKDNQDELQDGEQKSPGRFTGAGLVVPLLIVAVIAGYLFVLSSTPRSISYKLFKEQLRAKNVAELEILKQHAIGKFKQPVPPELPTGKTAAKKEPSPETATPEQGEKKKSATTKTEPVVDLRFVVTLPERASESAEFTQLLEESGHSMSERLGTHGAR